MNSNRMTYERYLICAKMSVSFSFSFVSETHLKFFLKYKIMKMKGRRTLSIQI